MYITVTVNIKGNNYNIQADENLPIQKATRDIFENFHLEECKMPVFYKSVLQRKLVSTYFTFGQSEIQNGDILLAIE